MGLRIKVLVADDSKEFYDVFKAYADLQNDIEIVGFARDGIEALKAIRRKKPDVVILDIIMPKLDGIAVLEELSKDESMFKPQIIVVSAMYNERITQKAIELGIEYYIIKPFDISVMVNRIREIKQPMKNNTLMIRNDSVPYVQSYTKDRPEPITSIEADITNILHDIGVPPHLVGYQYLRDAILLVSNDIGLINSVTRELYPSVAAIHKTKATRVERGIRHAIEIAWNRGRVDFIDSLFGYTINANRGRPTNSEFIAMFADKIRLEKIRN